MPRPLCSPPSTTTYHFRNFFLTSYAYTHIPILILFALAGAPQRVHERRSSPRPWPHETRCSSSEGRRGKSMGQARRDGRRGGSCSSGPPPIPVQSVGTSVVHGSERGAMPALLRSASLARPHFPFPRPNTKGTTTCSACTTNPGIRDFIDSRVPQLESEPTRDTGREGTRRRAASVSVLPPPHTREA